MRLVLFILLFTSCMTSQNISVNYIQVQQWMPNNFPTDGTGDISPYVDSALQKVYTNQQINNILLPPGKYKAHIKLDWDVHLIGTGGATWENYDHNTTVLIPLKDNDTIITVMTNAVQSSIEHIYFQGYNDNGDTAHIGIYFNVCANTVIHDLTFWDFCNSGVSERIPNAGTCIYINDGHSMKQSLPIFMKKQDYGFYCYHAENLSLDRPRILDNQKAGIYLEQCNNAILYNPDIESTALDTAQFPGFRVGIWMESSHYTQILYPYLECMGSDSSCVIYSGQKNFPDEGSGWSNDFTLIGGDIKHTSINPNICPIILHSKRNISHIISSNITEYHPGINVKPVDIIKNKENIVKLDFVKFSRQSLGQVIVLDINRYANEDWGNYNDYIP